MRAVLLALLVVSPCLARDVETKPPNAVKRVVNLLGEMKTQLEGEAKADSELYDKMVCWCETNDKEKTKAIADEEQAIGDLGAAINSNVAKGATLRSEIASLNQDISDNTEALSKASAMRTKEEDAFMGSEKQATTSIAAVKNAIKMLEKHNSLSQTNLMELSRIASQDPRSKRLLMGVAPSHLRTVMSFVQSAQTAKKHPSFLQQPANAGSYAPQSGVIFGILQQMQETFEINSADATSEEAEAVATYAGLRKAKTDEIAASEKKSVTKTAEEAQAEETAAMSRQGLADTRAALAADTEFLSNLKLTCDSLDREFNARTKMRADETAAVAETIVILTDDDNSEQMAKSLSFVQVAKSPMNSKAQAMDAKAREISQLLRAAGAKNQSPQMVSMATGLLQSTNKAMMSVKVNLNPAFAKVKSEVQRMQDDLKAQKKEEVKQNDACIAELRQLDVDMTASTNTKEDAEQKIADLQNAVATLDAEVAALQANIGASKVAIKKASEDRENENKEFQSVVNDQRATQAVLQKAVDRLKEFYDRKALLQRSSKTRGTPGAHAMKMLDGFLQEGKQTPPGGGFQPYKKKGGAGGVVGMIQDLIDDSKKLEAEATQDEKDAQTAYETMVNDSNASIDADTKEIANKVAEKAKLDGERANTEGSLSSTKKDLLALGELGQTIHGKCDFLIKNFANRQDSLVSEIEALDQSIAMLSGA